jgi:hypothetical protein
MILTIAWKTNFIIDTSHGLIPLELGRFYEARSLSTEAGRTQINADKTQMNADFLKTAKICDLRSASSAF